MPKRWAATTRFCRRSSSSQSHQLPGFCGFVNTPTRLPPPHPPFTQQVYKIGFDFFFLLFLQRQWWDFLCNSRTVSLRGRELISGLTDPKFKPVCPS